MSLIDEAAHQQFAELMGDSYEIIISSYFENSAKYIAEIKKGIESNDLNVIREASHPLKSSSNQIGLIGAGEIAKDIENDAIDGADIAVFIANTNKLESAISDSQQALKKCT